MKQEAEAARKILHSIYHFHWWNIKFSNPGILFNMQALENCIIALGCFRMPTLVGGIEFKEELQVKGYNSFTAHTTFELGNLRFPS